MPLPLTDTRPLFRPLSSDIVALLRALAADDWLRPTVARAWRVRDVAAHMVDTALRRLSFHRDGLIPSGAPPVAASDVAVLVNELNASWVRVSSRFSPRVLTDLYAVASASLADFIESLDLQAKARFPVSWAGQNESPQWLDIGREFTEIWHHGAQIRDAVHVRPFSEPQWLRAVLDIAMHALPAAYDKEPGLHEGSVLVKVTGASGSTWTLRKVEQVWDIEETAARGATTRVTLSDDTAWRLLFNGLAREDLRPLLTIEGDPALAVPLFRARAIVMS